MCRCRWCGALLPPNTGLIRYGFCAGRCRRENNRAAEAGLTPEQAQAAAAEAA